MTDPLIQALDAAAIALLERTKPSDSVEDRITMTEHVKALEAVANWAETRAKLQPKQAAPKQEGKRFHGLKSKFNGEARGRGASAADEEEPAGTA